MIKDKTLISLLFRNQSLFIDSVGTQEKNFPSQFFEPNWFLVFLITNNWLRNQSTCQIA